MNLASTNPKKGIGITYIGAPQLSAKLAKGSKAPDTWKLGGTSISPKLLKNENAGFYTYGVYLAPYTLSGFNVCPRATAGCIAACLNESGQARIDTSGKIQRARVKRTQLFYKDRPLFMQTLIKEITRERAKAERKGFNFCVRLNCTSDITPEIMKYNGQNILELFPDVQFYDYTKVPNRIHLVNRYPNYSLTFSRSGENDAECKAWLKAGGNVAVVFSGKTLPADFWGYPVINADETDLRFLDPRGVIAGLTYKKTRAPLDPHNNFVVHI